VQLNGKEFSKASLRDGDRLTVGSWEIEFHGDESANPPPVFKAEGPDVEPTELTSVDRLEAGLETLASAELEIAEANVCEAPTSENVISDNVAGCRGESAQTFQDELVLRLWVANHSARRRAKSLITGIRAARFHADAMAADLSAIETELDLARAAYDCHLGNGQWTQSESTDHRREQQELIQGLQAEVADLRSQLLQANDELSQQTGALEQALADAAALRGAVAERAADAALETRITELERQLAGQVDQLDLLTGELEAAQEQQRQISELHRLEAERAAGLEAALKELQSSTEATTPQPPEALLAAAPIETASPDVWQNVPQLAIEPVEPAPPSTWQAFEPALEDHGTAASAGAATPQPAAAAAPLAALPGPVELPELEEFAAEPSAAQPQQVAAVLANEAVEVEQPSEPAAAECRATPAWAPAPEKPAAEFSSPSFIDKYRHLLEEDNEPSPPAAKSLRAVIDDEFLSPAKVVTCASPSDESDDALEAYMANMMRRVRSTSASMGPASQVAVPEAPSTLRALTSASANSASQSSQQQYSPTDLLSEELISSEDLKQSTRKVPLARDLSALREIANSSARGAIAIHFQRQTRESAITKIIVAVTATVSSGYLMASAPAITNWQFWAGAATCAVGITAAVQVLIMERRRRS
jgi:hypothetical protein